jgi:hypothetical protein
VEQNGRAAQEGRVLGFYKRQKSSGDVNTVRLEPTITAVSPSHPGIRKDGTTGDISSTEASIEYCMDDVLQTRFTVHHDTYAEYRAQQNREVNHTRFNNVIRK